MTLWQAALIAWPFAAFPLGCITGRFIRGAIPCVCDPVLRNRDRPCFGEREDEGSGQEGGEGGGFRTIHNEANS